MEKPIPQTIEAATGPQMSEWPPSPNASENRPAIVVVLVMMIGTTRRRAANTIACSTMIPCLLRTLAASISTIAELTAMPVSATTPYRVNSESGFPDMSSPNTTPVKASGTVARIIAGCQ